MQHLEIHDELPRLLGEAADASGFEIYLVGGYVRDVLMRRATKDIDISVVGDGVAFARLLANVLHGSKLVVFERFGTARLEVRGVEIETVGTRTEVYDEASRKPVVSNGTIDEDLRRRDFTVNAMAVALNDANYGTLRDPFNGVADIEKKILRTPLDPETTFSDDPLRMMRACRFAAQLQFHLSATTRHGIERMNERISIVSMERIRDEFQKTLAAPKPSIGLALLMELGLLRHFLPDLHALAGVDQRSIEYPDGTRNFHHKDVFYHTLRVVDNVAKVSDDLRLRWSALLHDIAKPQTKSFSPEHGWSFHGHAEIGARRVKRIFRHLRLPHEDIHFIEKLVALHLRPMALVDEGVTDSAMRRLLFDAGEHIDALIQLCRADITSKNPKLVQKYLRNYESLVEKLKEVEEKDRLRSWQPPLSGDDIMRLCGVQAGIVVGVLKTRIEDAILDGLIPNDRDAAIEYLRNIQDEVLSAPRLEKPKSRKSMLAELPPELRV
ncbi:MAG: HD domain-containing protein [Ignavibacteriae bacterium]|nr:HD domain-containing protein [Ignavibacteriota bacterium]